MIEDFFDHTCDIYHLQRTTGEPGYGLPAMDNFLYPAKADIEGQQCHFGVKSSNVVLVQAEPQRDLEGKTKLTLPAGTDIRINDKIIDCDTGLEYTAEQPKNIRGHHMTVLIQRMSDQQAI